MTPAEMLAELLTQSELCPATEANAALQAIWPYLHAPQRSHGAAELVALFQDFQDQSAT